MGNKPSRTPGGGQPRQPATADSQPTRAQKLTGVVLGIFLCLAGIAIAVVSLSGVLPAGKSNSSTTWTVSIVLFLLGVMWLVIGLRRKR